MRYYPLFIDLTAKDILVVGAGAVGRRKISSLLTASPRRIVVLDPAFTPEIMRNLAAKGPVECRARTFRPEDLEGITLVFAATDNRKINADIASLCETRNILCNIADAPDLCSFIVPAHFHEGDLTIALSTNGSSPALAKRLRRELENFAKKRYTPLLIVLGRLRPLLLELGLDTAQNTAIIQSLVESSLGELLEHGNEGAVRELLISRLPKTLHPRLGDLLHGL